MNRAKANKHLAKGAEFYTSRTGDGVTGWVVASGILADAPEAKAAVPLTDDEDELIVFPDAEAAEVYLKGEEI